MIPKRDLFLKHQAQTTGSPLLFEPKYAQGIYLYDQNDKPYIDLISGIAVSSLGHQNKTINQAINEQLKAHSYVMVYGEFIQQSTVNLASRLSKILPNNLNCSYFVNSGSEAAEGALKLAKRYTGRTEIIAFRNAYHGSTHGALSVMGNEEFKQSFRPLLPDIRFLDFNQEDQLEEITSKTAAVIIEPIQGEAGVQVADINFMQALREQCNKTGTMLIFDECQTGFARTGKLFAFEHYNIVPDIITFAKAFGGGMPLGAFVSSSEIMHSLTHDPILGHISTFGGHPVSCAAGLASLEQILDQKIWEEVEEKGLYFKDKVKHPKILEIRGIGLMLAIELGSYDKVTQVIDFGLEHGFISDWFLFNNTSLRIAPPLNITYPELDDTINLLKQALDSIE